jgi:hypothetical protein
VTWAAEGKAGRGVKARRDREWEGPLGGGRQHDAGGAGAAWQDQQKSGEEGALDNAGRGS